VADPRPRLPLAPAHHQPARGRRLHRRPADGGGHGAHGDGAGRDRGPARDRQRRGRGRAPVRGAPSVRVPEDGARGQRGAVRPHLQGERERERERGDGGGER
jgi:hypothetical protein